MEQKHNKVVHNPNLGEMFRRNCLEFARELWKAKSEFSEKYLVGLMKKVVCVAVSWRGIVEWGFFFFPISRVIADSFPSQIL